MMQSRKEWAKNQYSKQYPKIAGKKAKRSYLHFDIRPPHDEYRYVEYALAITEPTSVKKHPFWPFLRYIKANVKRKRDKNGKVVVKKKKRPIDYAAHSDSLIYSWYAHMLSNKYDEEIEREKLGDEVIAYRKLGKSNVDFFKEVSDFVEKHQQFVILAFDVSDFFGSIRHEKLKQRICRVLDVIRLEADWFAVYTSVIHYSFVNKSWIKYLTKGVRSHKRICDPRTFRKLRQKGIIQTPRIAGKGIPQGSPISCVFANIYMLDLDCAMKRKCAEVGGIYRRYSDDILLIIPEKHAQVVELFFKSKIEEEDLNFSTEKTERWQLHNNKVFKIDESYQVICEKNFSYLGVEFSGTNYYLRHRGIARVRSRIVKGIKSAKEFKEYYKLQGLPWKRIWNRFGKVHNTFRSYRDRAFETLGGAKTIKMQYSDRKVESFLKKMRSKYDE